jgi:transposase
MNITSHDPSDLATLDTLIAKERDALQRDRYRVARLALGGAEALHIADKLGRSRKFVQDWAYAYRDRGIDALTPKPRPGRKPKLEPEQQRAFIEQFKQGPTGDDSVCTLRGQDAQRILAEHFGVAYSLNAVYNLLHRHGLSCLKPRPQHRKNDPKAMADFLERAPFLSKTSATPTPINPLKSGSRTKPASASKAR